MTAQSTALNVPVPVGGRMPGLVLALVSAAAFGSSGPFAKALLDSGWSPGGAVTVRIAGAALALMVPALVLIQGRWHLVLRNVWLITTFGVVAMAAVQLFFFNAVSTLSVSVALLLEYLGVVLIVLWLWIRYGRRPQQWTLAGVVLSVVGLLLVLDVLGGLRIDLTGALWGFAAAAGLASYFVLSASETDGLPAIVMAAGGMVVATIALLLAGAFGVVPLDFTTSDVQLAGRALPWWVPVAALSLVSAALAYAAGIVATRDLGSKVAGFVGLTEVLFSTIFAWILLGELPLPVQLAGGVLIVAGVAAVRYDETRQVPPADPTSTPRSAEQGDDEVPSDPDDPATPCP